MNVRKISIIGVVIVVALFFYMAVSIYQSRVQLATVYPNYGFERHVGYGTAQHRQALEKHGVLSVHRVHYKPIRSLLKLGKSCDDLLSGRHTDPFDR